MAMGKRRRRLKQASMWVATQDLPRSAAHPFYTRLNQILDTADFDSHVEMLCQPFYADDVGRPGLPPGRYFRMLLLGYFEGLDSERAIAWRTADSLSIRSFLGLELHEAPPDHSTVSRTRRLIDLETHQAVFTWVLHRLADAGLVKGKTIGIDATTLEANAALRSIVRRDTGETYDEFLTRLAQASGIETPTREDLARIDRKRKHKGSNDDWTHPRDPDAKITKMKDHRTHLAHKAEYAVDLETGAVVAVTVQGADEGDTTTSIETLIEAAEQVETVVPEGEGIKEVVGDKGYHSNQVMVDLEAIGVRSYISEPDRGRRNWEDNPEARDAVYRNRRRIRGTRGKRLLRLRGERLERPFAHLYETGRMRRVHMRGHDNILKRVLLHAAALNLGLLLRTLCGVGTPRALQGRVSVLLDCLWSLIPFPITIWTHIWTLFRPSALPEAHATVARCVSSSPPLRPLSPRAARAGYTRLIMPARVAATIAVIALTLAAAPRAQGPAAAGDGAWLDAYREPAARLIGEALSGSAAWNRLAELTDTFGPRLAGSENLERAIEWAVAEMKKDGLDEVRAEPVMVPHWVRGRESLEIVAPVRSQLVMLGLGNSVGTPPEGVEGEVLVVRNWHELDAHAADAKGRIVLFNVPYTNYGETVQYRSRGASRAATHGAIAMLLRSVGPTGLRTPHTGSLQYTDGAPRIPAAAIPAEDANRLQRMQDRGTKVVVRLMMEARFLPDAPSANVIGELRGRERPGEVVVVGCHFDSWDVGTGATDDGGGCIAAWEAVRMMKVLALRPRRTVRAVLFSNEENGLRGGLGYRDRHREELASHVLMIESDGGVFRPTGFGFTGSERARATIERIAGLLKEINATDVRPGGGGADIGPSVEAGKIPAMSLNVDGHYFLIHHTPADTVERIAPEDIAKSAAALAVVAYVVADMPERLR